MSENYPIHMKLPPGAEWVQVTYMDRCPAQIPPPAAKENDDSGVKVAVAGVAGLLDQGIPVELIATAIENKDMHTARAALRTTLLEYLYEKIETVGAEVSFVYDAEDRLQNTIESGLRTYTVADNCNASVLAMIEDLITETTQHLVEEGLSEKHHIEIALDKFLCSLVALPGKLEVEMTVALNVRARELLA